MNIDRAVLAFAGLVVLISLTLGYFFSPYWLLLTAFAGLNLLQAAFTGFCPAALKISAAGQKPVTPFVDGAYLAKREGLPTPCVLSRVSDARPPRF